MVKLPGTEAYDARSTCSNTKHRDHNMEELGVGLGEESNNQQGEASAQRWGASRCLSIQRCIQLLIHACHCSSARCHLLPCRKMKRVVQHTKGCKRKTNGGCPICKQFIALCCSHARHCQENNCPVPFCLRIRQRFNIIRRRMTSLPLFWCGRTPAGSAVPNS